MDKRIACGIVAVLVFFAGAIWVSEVPVVATLVAFLECCAGMVIGYFLCKFKTDSIIELCEKEVEMISTELNDLKAAKTKSAPKAKKPAKAAANKE